MARLLIQLRAAVNKSGVTPLLGPVDVRDLAATLGVQPTKKLGQNFVHDAGTVRKIVRNAQVNASDTVVEVGPGLGSLTLGLLAGGARVCAVEIDPILARALAQTVQSRLPYAPLRVYTGDALKVSSWEQIAPGWSEPNRMVANLPYNVAVPILLHFLAMLPSLESVLVMVQSEVADRIVAAPGSRTYGVPSVKAAWYGQARRAGTVGRNVFWPAPNVDSALVDIQISPRVRTDRLRNITFKIVDVAFEQRRKMLRAALRKWIGDTAEVTALLDAAQIDPTRRGETLTVDEFVTISECATSQAKAGSPALAKALESIEVGYRNA